MIPDNANTHEAHACRLLKQIHRLTAVPTLVLLTSCAAPSPNGESDSYEAPFGKEYEKFELAGSPNKPVNIEEARMRIAELFSQLNIRSLHVCLIDWHSDWGMIFDYDPKRPESAQRQGVSWSPGFGSKEATARWRHIQEFGLMDAVVTELRNKGYTVSAGSSVKIGLALKGDLLVGTGAWSNQEITSQRVLTPYELSQAYRHRGMQGRMQFWAAEPVLRAVMRERAMQTAAPPPCDAVLLLLSTTTDQRMQWIALSFEIFHAKRMEPVLVFDGGNEARKSKREHVRREYRGSTEYIYETYRYTENKGTFVSRTVQELLDPLPTLKAAPSVKQ